MKERLVPVRGPADISGGPPTEFLTPEERPRPEGPVRGVDIAPPPRPIKKPEQPPSTSRP